MLETQVAESRTDTTIQKPVTEKQYPFSASSLKHQTLPERRHRFILEPINVDRRGHRFEGQICTIKVGTDSTNTITFKIHENVLSQSPILAQFIRSAPQFAEGQTTDGITLPEDPPAAFGLMVEYLYTLEYSPSLASLRDDYYNIDKFNNSHWVSEQAALSAQLYLLAEKYQLTQLQRLITSKLYRLSSEMSDRLFFETSKTIYDSTAEERLSSSFFGFFQEMAPGRVLIASCDDWFFDYFEEGGIFAADLGRLLATASRKRQTRLGPVGYDFYDGHRRKRRRSVASDEWD